MQGALLTARWFLRGRRAGQAVPIPSNPRARAAASARKVGERENAACFFPFRGTYMRAAMAAVEGTLFHSSPSCPKGCSFSLHHTSAACQTESTPPEKHPRCKVYGTTFLLVAGTNDIDPTHTYR